MSLAPVPPGFDVVLAIPGRNWDESAVLDAYDWVFSGSSLRYLTLKAGYALGGRLGGLKAPDEIAKDAEDACQDFAIRRFRRVVGCYNPDRCSFEGFVLFCFRRWCKARARVLWRLSDRARPLDDLEMRGAVSSEEGPEARLLKIAGRLEAARVVADAMAGLSASDRALLRLEYWDDMNVAARAATISCSPVATRVRAHRARGRLANALRPTAATLGFGGLT